MLSSLTLIALLLGQTDENDLRTYVPKNPFECAHARSFRFDSTGRRLTGVTQRGELLVWNGDGESPVVTVLEKKPGGGVFDRAPMKAVPAGEGDNIVLFYHDGRAQVWSVDKGLKVKDLESDRKDFGYAYASPDGELVGCLSYRQQGKTSAILLWNTRDWTSAGKIETPENIYDFCFTKDGHEVLACVGHPTDQKDQGFTGIVAWNLADKQETGRIEYGTGFPIRIAVSRYGRWVATGGGDAVPVAENARMLSGHLRVFDWEAKKFVAELYALDTDYVRTVQFSPDSLHLYSGSYSTPPGGGQYISEIKAHRVADWDLAWMATLGNGNPHEMTVSPNGKDILVPDSDSLHVVDAEFGIVRGAKLTFRFFKEDQEKE